MVMLFTPTKSMINNQSVSPIQNLNSSNYETNQVQQNVNKSIQQVNQILGATAQNYSFVGLTKANPSYSQPTNSPIILNYPISDPYNCFDTNKNVFVSPITGLLTFTSSIFLTGVVTSVFIDSLVNSVNPGNVVYGFSSTISSLNINFTWQYLANQGDTVFFYYVGGDSTVSNYSQIVMTWR